MSENSASVTDLRMISGDLRAKASRALRSPSDTAPVNVQRLLDYVRATPILFEMVDSVPSPELDPIQAVRDAGNKYESLKPPIDEEEELGFLHALLEGIASLDEELWRVAYGYAGKRGIRDSSEALLNDVIPTYVRYLNRRLERAILEHPQEGGPGVAVHISGGTSQLNIAQGRSRVVARQEVGETLGGLIDSAKEFLAEVDAQIKVGPRTDELEGIKEIGEALLDELSRQQPRKQLLQVLHERLVLLSGSLVAADTITDKATALLAGVRGLFD
jgi:hypothetical protein